MINITLTPEEANELSEILKSFLSDLRMEVADTDRKDWRDWLKTRERFIGNVLERLQPA